MFSEILLVINLCFIAFYYLQEKKKTVAEEKKKKEEDEESEIADDDTDDGAFISVDNEDEEECEKMLKIYQKKVEENQMKKMIKEQEANYGKWNAEEKKKEDEKDVNTWYTIEDGLSRYKGEWKNGLPNGKGIKHYYKTDSYIEGNFVDSFAHGYCKQTFEQTWEKTVPYYEGEFKRNQWVKGEYHYGDGDYYKGEWKDGKYNGQGAAYSLRINRTWVGEYKNDEKVNGGWVKGEI